MTIVFNFSFSLSWLSGIIHIYNPQVWACCLRYMFSSSIQERQVKFFLSFYLSSNHTLLHSFRIDEAPYPFRILTNQKTKQIMKNLSSIKLKLNQRKKVSCHYTSKYEEIHLLTHKIII